MFLVALYKTPIVILKYNSVNMAWDKNTAYAINVTLDKVVFKI